MTEPTRQKSASTGARTQLLWAPECWLAVGGDPLRIAGSGFPRRVFPIGSGAQPDLVETETIGGSAMLRVETQGSVREERRARQLASEGARSSSTARGSRARVGSEGSSGLGVVDRVTLSREGLAALEAELDAAPDARVESASDGGAPPSESSEAKRSASADGPATTEIHRLAAAAYQRSRSLPVGIRGSAESLPSLFL